MFIILDVFYTLQYISNWMNQSIQKYVYVCCPCAIFFNDSSHIVVFLFFFLQSCHVREQLGFGVFGGYLVNFFFPLV